MDLLDGPDRHDGPDLIEMDAPIRSWERYAGKWRSRWRESGRFTRAVTAGSAIAVLAGAAVIAYAVTRPPAAATGNSASVTAAGTIPGEPEPQVQWANGPRGKPWAVVGVGSAPAISGIQTGAVTAIGPASVTVRSADGQVATYSVSSATQVNFQGDAAGSIHKGETVAVIAERAGKTVVALVIENLPTTVPGQRSPSRMVVLNPATGKPAP